MAKDNRIIIFVLVLVAVAAFFFFSGDSITPSEGSQSTSGDLIRTVPEIGGGSFEVEYSSNESGEYAVIIEDSVSGDDCEFQSGKTTYKSVMIGNGPTSQSVTVTGRNCVFSGDYNFVDESGVGDIIEFGEQTVK